MRQKFCLPALAMRMCTCVGGDEFVIVLFDVDLNAVNEKIVKCLYILN